MGGYSRGLSEAYEDSEREEEEEEDEPEGDGMYNDDVGLSTDIVFFLGG